MDEQLIQQARRLTRLDPRKPKQSNLRRAISSAYYALFHFLVDQACRSAIGARHHQSALRQVLGRAFEHATMRNACLSFAGGNLRTSVAKGIPSSFLIPIAIKEIADTYVEIQSHRHLADYDLTERFRRSQVRSSIEQVAASIGKFKRLAASNEKKFFLACLWAWKNLVKR